MPKTKKPSKEKAVSTAPDQASDVAETAFPTIVDVAIGRRVTKTKLPPPSRDQLPSLLRRLIKLEAWAKRVVATVPTIPSHQVDDDIEGT